MLLYTVEKKGHLKLILHQLQVTWYRKIFIYQIPCGGQVRKKNSWISHLSQQSISHYYSEVQKGRTDILYFFTSSMSENRIRLNGILQTWIYKSLETWVSSSLIKSARFSLLFYLALKPCTYSLVNKQNTNWYCFRNLHSCLRTTLRQNKRIGLNKSRSMLEKQNLICSMIFE